MYLAPNPFVMGLVGISVWSNAIFTENDKMTTMQTTENMTRTNSCCLPMINSRIFGIAFVVAAVTSIMTVTAVSSQNAMATVLVGFDIDTGNVSTSDADIDVAEAAEAGNATTMVINQTTNGNMTDVQFLSIQTAQSGSLSQVNDTAYSLELDNVSDSTVLFSDRPERIVTTVSTSDFVGNWTTGPFSFAEDAPNDALIVENTQTGQLETDVIESFNPTYDANANTLTYTIVVENETSMNLPSKFGQSILMIDGAHPIHIHL